MSGGQQQQEQQKEVFHAQILYREWGRRFTVLQQYLKGIHYYEKSTEHGDENFLWTLLGLSEALKKSGQFKEAAEIVEKCMKMGERAASRAFYRSKRAKVNPLLFNCRRTNAFFPFIFEFHRVKF